MYTYNSGNTTPPNIAIAGVCPPAAAGNDAGYESFVLKAILEDHNDPDLKSSFAKCKDTNVSWATLPNGGSANDVAPADGIDDFFYYYVCSD